jgi:Na+/melibiose symporter-like transporter
MPVVQTEATIQEIRLMMFVLPIFGLMLSRYIFSKKHFIDEEGYTNILEKLAVQRSNK